MFSKTWSIVVAVLALVAIPLSHAEKPADLEQSMETMNKAFRTLKKQISSASQKGTNLESIAKMKNAAIAARSGLPENAGKIPQADRSKFIQDFQSSISGLVAAIEKMEKAVQEDRFQDAQKELDSINELKREGHSAFAEKKER